MSLKWMDTVRLYMGETSFLFTSPFASAWTHSARIRGLVNHNTLSWRCTFATTPASLIIPTTTLHVEIHNSPAESLVLLIVVALEGKNVVVGQHFVLGSFHDFALAVADAIDLLGLKTHQDDRSLLVLSLHTKPY
jgi:hypothetical protein